MPSSRAPNPVKTRAKKLFAKCTRFVPEKDAKVRIRTRNARSKTSGKSNCQFGQRIFRPNRKANSCAARSSEKSRCCATIRSETQPCPRLRKNRFSLVWKKTPGAQLFRSRTREKRALGGEVAKLRSRVLESRLKAESVPVDASQTGSSRNSNERTPRPTGRLTPTARLSSA